MVVGKFQKERQVCDLGDEASGTRMIDSWNFCNFVDVDLGFLGAGGHDSVKKKAEGGRRNLQVCLL